MVGSLLLVAGCGSSAPTKAEYVKRANAICRTTAGAIGPLEGQLASAAGSIGSAVGSTSAGQLAGVLRRLHNATDDALTKLRGLSQPTGAHAAIERILTPLASLSAALDRAARTAAAGQPQKAIATLEAAAPDAKRMAEAARAYGLTACAAMLGPLATGALNPVRVTLVADNHAPVVNKPWHYTVTVTGPGGAKLSGTETTHYTFNGVVVGTEKPVNVPFTAGVYHDTVEFPPAAVGHPLAVQVVVRTSLGSATASWPIKVIR